jgi:hypothetical protein
MTRGIRLIAVDRFYWPDESATVQILTGLAEHLAAAGREVVAWLVSRQMALGSICGLGWLVDVHEHSSAH